MCAITLIMALLEHLGDGLQQHLPTICSFYLQEMAVAETKEYKNMIIQGLMMNFWYDQATTIQSLQAHGALDNVFAFILSNVEGMDKDFEVKRLLIGLSTLTLSATSSELDPSVQARFPDCTKAILFLCERSLQLREKKIKRDKEDEAIEDKDCEKGAIYDESDDENGGIDIVSESDEDDEWDFDDDNEEELHGDLYDTIFDDTDEVLFVKDKFDELQQKNPQHFQNVLALLDENETNGLQNLFQQAHLHK